MIGNRGAIIAKVGELAIGEGRVQRAVADRVERHRHATAARLGHRMMLFDAAPERARAQPAGLAQPVQAPVRLPVDLARIVMLPIGVDITMRFSLSKVVGV